MTPLFENSSTAKDIVAGLEAGGVPRRMAEKKLFENFFYLIKHGSKKYSLSEDDAASAYSDAVISVIESIVTHKFERRSSLKSYIYKIFSNKCVDIVRKETTNKGKVHKTADLNDYLALMPDTTKSIIQKMIERNERNFLKEKLDEIGEKCKQLLLFFEDGYSDREIAAVMLYNSPDVVKTSRLRCLEKLKKSFSLQ